MGTLENVKEHDELADHPWSEEFDRERPPKFQNSDIKGCMSDVVIKIEDPQEIVHASIAYKVVQVF